MPAPAAGRGAGRGRDRERLRHRPAHLQLGRVVAAADPPAADARPRVRRHGRRARRAGPERLGRRLRLRREPHHLRHVLPVPHRPCAHVRADADPRRRPRRRLRALRRRARGGDLAERPLEAAARDRHAPGAVRQRGVRDQRAGSRRPLGRGARLRADRPVHDRDRARLGRRRGDGRRPHAVPARARREDGRERGRQRRRDAGHWRSWFLDAQRAASASTSSSRCPARRARSPTRS